MSWFCLLNCSCAIQNYLQEKFVSCKMIVFDLFNRYVMCDKTTKDSYMCINLVFGDTVFKCSVVSCHIIIGEGMTWASTGQTKILVAITSPTL